MDNAAQSQTPGTWTPEQAQVFDDALTSIVAAVDAMANAMGVSRAVALQDLAEAAGNHFQLRVLVLVVEDDSSLELELLDDEDDETN